MSSTEIRFASKDDVPAITAIYNHAVIHTTATQDVHPQSTEARMSWFLAHDPSTLPVFVYEKDGEVLGWASLSFFSDRIGYNRTVENAVYLSPAAQGQGVGTRLLHRLVDSAKEIGYHCIIAKIASENTASIQLHKKFNFDVVGVLKEAGYKFDRYCDITLMQLLL